MSTLNQNTETIRGLIESINALPEDGYIDGYNKGYSEGETAGYSSGYETGKNDGYEDGQKAEQTYTNEILTGNTQILSNDEITELHAYRFYSFSKLTSANIPNAKALGAYVFYNCTALVKVDCGAESINSYAFSRCGKLTAVILRANAVCTLGNTNAFGNTPIANGTGYVYVPDNLVEQYKAATNWSTFASQIKPISELGE